MPWGMSGAGYSAVTGGGDQQGIGGSSFTGYTNGIANNSSGGGGFGGGSFGGGGGGSINGLMQQQLADNAWARQNNLAEWTQAKGQLLNVPGQYQNDPMRQGSRALGAQMLANPEAINDRTQQLAVNRGSNLINAASNSQMNGMMGDAASMGQLGSSSMQAGYQGIQNQRMGQLMGMGSDLEIKRAQARNQDMYSAINMGSQLAGQDHGVNMGVASEYIQNLPQFKADNLSGLIATMGQLQGQGGGGMSMMQGGRGTGSQVGQPAGQMGFAGNWTAPQQQGQSVNAFGAYQNNYQPTTGQGAGYLPGGGQYSSGGNVSNQMGGQNGRGQQGGNAYTPGTVNPYTGQMNAPTQGAQPPSYMTTPAAQSLFGTGGGGQMQQPRQPGYQPINMNTANGGYGSSSGTIQSGPSMWTGYQQPSTITGGWTNPDEDY